MWRDKIASLFGRLKRMFGRGAFSQTALPQTVITDSMATAIDRWVALYYNRGPHLAHNPLTLGLPAAIAREIATLVTLEAKINVVNAGKATDDESTDKLNPRAQFISDMLEPLLSQLTIQTEYACAFGGIVFRPYVDGKRIAIDCVNADNFYPTAFNARGEITGALFLERKRDGNDTYTRVEQHEMLDNGEYMITNRAYHSYNNTGSDMGMPVSLSSVAEWADIAPELPLHHIESPLFAYFRIPQGNVVDVDSLLGVSVYARADSAGLLAEVDRQFQRLAWEYEAGEMAIDASVDAFKKDQDGRPILPVGKERLFRVNELDSTGTGNGKFNPYSPTLRDSSYAEGLNRLLMRVEDLCGIARGTYSDANDAVRTATELKISKQRTYATITSIQMSLQDALNKLAVACDTLATVYNLAAQGEFEISYTWDDSIVVDADTERDKDRQDVLDGLMQPWEYRVKWYGETVAQAQAAMAKTRTPVDEALNDTEDEPTMDEE